MATDWVARGLGIAGVLSGFGALAWSVISWRREGPVLKAHAAYVYGSRDDVQITGHLANRGRLQATITQIEVSYQAATPIEYDVKTRKPGFKPGKGERRFLVSSEVQGITLDQPILPQAGGSYVITLSDSSEIRTSLDRRYPATVHFWTATGGLVDARVRYRRHQPRLD